MNNRSCSSFGINPRRICYTLSLMLVLQSQCLPSWADPNKARELARAKMQEKDFQAAIPFLDTACGASRTDPENFMLRGRCFFRIKKFDLAIQDFNMVLDKSPNYFPAFLWRGSAHAKLGTDDLAIKDYEQAIRLNPKLAKRYFNPPGAKEGKQDKAVVNAERYRLPGVSPENQHSKAVEDYKSAMKLVYPDGFSESEAKRVGSANPGTYASVDADDQTYLTDMAAGGEVENESSEGPSVTYTKQLKDGKDKKDRAQGRDGDEGKGNKEAQDDGTRKKSDRNARGEYQALADRSVRSSSTNAGGNLDIGRSDERLDPAKDRRVVNRLGQDPDYGEFGKVPGSQPLDGDPETVIKRCTEAIRQDDSNAEYFYMRAKAYQKLSKVNDAYRDYSEAIRIGPNVAKYYIGRASMFYQLNKPLLVDADVKRAQSMDQLMPHVVHFGGDPYPPSVRWSGDGADGN